VVLVLEVISPHASALGSAARQTFDVTGGSIGRVPGNSWVLPHPKVSKEHAVISYAGGVFYIEDRDSTNGVFLNSSRNRLTRGQPHPLSSGDRLLIEPYEIRISVEADEPASPGRSDRASDADPFAALGDLVDDPFAPAQSAQPLRGASFEPAKPNRPSPSPSAFDTPDQVSRADLDPLALLNLHDDRPASRKGPPPPSAHDLEGGSLLDQHFRPPPAVPDVRPVSAPPLVDPLAIPQDYDPLAPDEPVAPPSPRRQAPAPPPIVERSPLPQHADVDPRPPRPRFGPKPAPRPDVVAPAPRIEVAPPAPEPVARRPPEPVPPPPPPPPAAPAPSASAAEGIDLAAVLAGAGLKPGDVTPELARAFGQIIRVVVSGVMDVLQSRRELKDEFRMRMTQFRPRENNPLKFSANVEDALHNLLVKRNAAFLGPVDAFEDAFTELRNHQVAMLAGMRVAFESMLAEFDPDRLQEDFDQRASKGLLAKLGRSYWDLFRDKRREMAKDPEATFRQLFGDEFARAYEEQLQRLKNQGPAAPGAVSKPKPPTEG